MHISEKSPSPASGLPPARLWADYALLIERSPDEVVPGPLSGMPTYVRNEARFRVRLGRRLGLRVAQATIPARACYNIPSKMLHQKPVPHHSGRNFRWRSSEITR